MEEIEAVARLSEIVPREFLAHALAVELVRLVHGSAGDVLENHEDVVAGLVVDHLVESNDVLVRQLLHDGDLLAHRAPAPVLALARVLAAEELAVYALHGAQAVVLRVQTQLHPAERTLAEVLDHHVLVQVRVALGVRAERHRARAPEFLLVDTPPRGAPSRRSRARVARRGGER